MFRFVALTNLIKYKMRTKLLALVALVMSMNSFAQNNVMNEGDLLMNAGIGFGVFVYDDPVYQETNSVGSMASFSISGEYGMFPTGKVGIVSLGGIIGMGSGKSTEYNYDVKRFSTDIQFRGAWHLSAWDNSMWDVYAGLGSGVRINSTKYTNNLVPGHDSDDSSTDFTISQFLGARWMMKDNFGLVGEVSFGELSFVKVGCTLKF